MNQAFHDPRVYLEAADDEVGRLRNLATIAPLLVEANERVAANRGSRDRAERLQFQQRSRMWFRQAKFGTWFRRDRQQPEHCLCRHHDDERRCGSVIDDLFIHFQVILEICGGIADPRVAGSIRGALAVILDQECYDITCVAVAKLDSMAAGKAQMDQAGWDLIRDAKRIKGEDIGPLIENGVYYEAVLRPIEGCLIARFTDQVENCLERVVLKNAQDETSSAPLDLSCYMSATEALRDFLIPQSELSRNHLRKIKAPHGYPNPMGKKVRVLYLREDVRKLAQKLGR